MVAELIDGNSIAKAIRSNLNKEIADIQVTKPYFKPSLVIIQVGDRPDSSTYVRMKLKAAAEANISCEAKKIPESVTQAQVSALSILQLFQTVWFLFLWYFTA